MNEYLAVDSDGYLCTDCLVDKCSVFESLYSIGTDSNLSQHCVRTYLRSCYCVVGYIGIVKDVTLTVTCHSIVSELT